MSMATGVFVPSWYEQDERWTKVDAYTMQHLHPKSSHDHAFLSVALKHSLDAGLPDIATQPVFARLMAIQCRASNVKHALEIGALGGFTSIFLASMNPDMQVTSVEIIPRHAEVARENIARAGFSDRINVIVGPALEVLPRLKEEIDAGSRPPFGFTYIDADKQNNWTYFDLAIGLSKSSGLIYVDNVVIMGTLVDERLIRARDERVMGSRQLVENAGKDSRVAAVVQQTVAEKTYDGYLMAVVL
ncbi:hypothetical protein AAFC00_000561 [Neodothiora populina]|uniref:O-methyltransferase n=1 Tax=Neodothiora populina TaxID=2781224 RepID=A0ABR3PDU6_9PEZI